jgi:eukaryotic-like serine/threonine-protein kinase
MIGSTLDGRYRIDAVLGMGGMGCVYRGVHTGLQRPFAIKVLAPRAGRDSAVIESFRREAFASGQLDHPNIIAVSDFGALEDGSMFLAMEVLDGESLRTRLDRDDRLAWTDAMEIMRGMLAGLGYAHDREIIHCDVKPENIFLATCS